jgi:hypothetical protein
MAAPPQLHDSGFFSDSPNAGPGRNRPIGDARVPLLWVGRSLSRLAQPRRFARPTVLLTPRENRKNDCWEHAPMPYYFYEMARR